MRYSIIKNTSSTARQFSAWRLWRMQDRHRSTHTARSRRVIAAISRTRAASVSAAWLIRYYTLVAGMQPRRQAMLFLASLLDQPVQGKTGEMIGRLEDLIVLIS